ncbi:MAG: hypothetical protein K2X03_17870 [Bryobacteraceae bacterium]|nr:hypothetical protein [Bryobacteraceae bacterium]
MTLTLRIFLASACTLCGQTPPKPSMSFFVTSTGLGDGGNLGGLAGADAHCQKLASAAGAGEQTWRAYLSTQTPGIDARDRIGPGPWHNAKGVQIAGNLAELHGDTLELARKGNLITKNNALTEKGEIVNGIGDQPVRHDILTGSQADGRAFPVGAGRTCNNWTSNGEGTAQVGHHDRNGGGLSWNSVHASPCAATKSAASGGAGLFYCFAAK